VPRTEAEVIYPGEVVGLGDANAIDVGEEPKVRDVLEDDVWGWGGVFEG